jgi:ApaG protein
VLVNVRTHAAPVNAARPTVRRLAFRARRSPTREDRAGLWMWGCRILTEVHGAPKALVRASRAWHCERVSTALTQGIRVTVSTVYVPSQSAPTSHRYVFAYTIRIANEGAATAQLKSRHWIITHGNGKVEEVRGPGVVGQQPVLKPGEHFEYTSGCVLETPRGTMRGTYQMHTPDGRAFDAEIASFQLAMPHSLN